MTKTPTYGQAVYDLAKSFINESGADKSEENYDALAREMQAAIEDTLSSLVPTGDYDRDSDPVARREDAKADAAHDQRKDADDYSDLPW